MKKRAKKIVKPGQEESEFLKTYIPGLDVLLGNGIPKGNAVLVEGGPGSGKTIFCLQVLKHAAEMGKNFVID